MIARGWPVALVLAACASSPAALQYDMARLQGPALDGTLVIAAPYDDRYAAERSGETFTTKLAVGALGFAYGRHQGNQVTGDPSFACPDGPFARDVSGGLGNLMYAALEREGGSGVRADGSGLAWSCGRGTCVPTRESVLAAAARHGARYVLATRLVHLYGMRFGERTFSVATGKETYGTTTYQVTRSYQEASYSAGFGNASIELSLFEIEGGAIVHTTRRSFAAIEGEHLEATRDVDGQMAKLAVTALGKALDAFRSGMGATAPATAPAVPPPPAPPVPPLGAPTEREEPPV